MFRGGGGTMLGEEEDIKLGRNGTLVRFSKDICGFNMLHFG